MFFISPIKVKGVADFATPLKTKLLVLILALLICNAARGLASRLARGLALATATVLNGLCNILSFDSIDSLHYCNPPIRF